MPEYAIILGSNIHPQHNLPSALDLLREQVIVTRVSSIWETEAVGGGPDFWNQAVCVTTPMDAEQLKWDVLRRIEDRLGRIRASDKNAPRTIDLDIILEDTAVLDANLWQRAFLAVPFAELFPDLRHPESGQPLAVLAGQLKQRSVVRRLPRPDCC